MALKLWFIILNLLGRLAIKYGTAKTEKKPVIAKPELNAKKVLFAIFFGEGVPVQVPVKKGKSITVKPV